MASAAAVLLFSAAQPVIGQAIPDIDRPIKTAVRNPEAIAVVIGIAKYQHPDVPEVGFAVKDAQAIRELLIQTLGYPADRVLLRTNEEASLARLRPIIRQMLPTRVAPGKSDLFVYYSGHGAPNTNTREPYLIPFDYDPSFMPTSDSAYSLKELYADLGKLNARSVTVVLDACFSGLADTAAGRAATVVKYARPGVIEVDSPVAQLPNGLAIAATGPGEIASWQPEAQHGLLTYYLLRALRGEAADEKGRVTAAELERYLKEKVPKAAEQLRQRNQTPQVIAQDAGRVLAQLPISALRTGQAQVVQTFGSLEITVDLGGELLLDDISQGTLSAGQRFIQRQIAAGPHQIEIRKERYRPVSEQVIVPPDQPLRKTYQLAAILPEKPQLEKAYGLIQVTADADGTLYIDDVKAAELSPFAKYTTGRIEAGPHRVRVEKPGYQAAEQQVLVLPNQTATAELKLAPPSAPPVGRETQPPPGAPSLAPTATPSGAAERPVQRRIGDMLNQTDAKRPTFETESYRVTIESVRRRGNSITVTLVFESVSESKIALSWGWSFEPDGGLYLLGENGEKWVAERRPGLMARDDAGIVFTPGMGQVSLLPGTKIKTKFVFGGSGTSSSFTLVSREGAPRSGRDIVIHGLVPN